MNSIHNTHIRMLFISTYAFIVVFVSVLFTSIRDNYSIAMSLGGKSHVAGSRVLPFVRESVMSKNGKA